MKKIKKWICGYLAKFLRMKYPNQTRDETLFNKKNEKYDLIREFNEISSKSLLANVIDEKTREFVLNDDFGIIRSNQI